MTLLWCPCATDGITAAGSTPVPEARMDDGVLHTVLVKNISRVKFAGLFSAYSAGRYRSLPPEVIRVVTAKTSAFSRKMTL